MLTLRECNEIRSSARRVYPDEDRGPCVAIALEDLKAMVETIAQLIGQRDHAMIRAHTAESFSDK